MMMMGVQPKRGDGRYRAAVSMVPVNPALGTSMDELQRISACMFGSPAPASLAHQAVIGMEMSLLEQGWPVGKSLGALPDVRKRLGLGRPAFREAITILQARGLLDVRRGPGGGLFVGAPVLEDVVGAVLMYLALARQTSARIVEFRLVVWRMAVAAAIQRHVSPRQADAEASPWGFAVDLAEQTGNPTMVLLARLAEMLVRTASCGAAPVGDPVLEGAIRQGDLARSFARLDEMAGLMGDDAPVITLEVAERGFSLAGRKSAMALAARMTRELSERSAMQEAEWETAERLGYTDAVVRQARRILQDFGIVRCRQGRKGAELATAIAPTGVVRLLAPCLMASAMSALDEREAISFLISDAAVLAVRYAKSAGAVSVGRFVSAPDADAFEALTLENLLLERSGNPLLGIVVRSLGVASVFAAGDPQPPVDLREVNLINRSLLQAINTGDVGVVNILARIKLEIMQRPAHGYREVA